MRTVTRPAAIALTGIWIYLVGFGVLREALGLLVAKRSSAEERIIGSVLLALAFVLAWVATGLLTMLEKARVQALCLLVVVSLLTLGSLLRTALSEHPVFALLPVIWLVPTLIAIAYLLRPSTAMKFTPKPSVDASLRESSNL